MIHLYCFRVLEKNKKEVMWVYFPKNKVHISKIKYKIPIYLES